MNTFFRAISCQTTNRRVPLPPIGVCSDPIQFLDALILADALMTSTIWCSTFALAGMIGGKSRVTTSRFLGPHK